MWFIFLCMSKNTSGSTQSLQIIGLETRPATSGQCIYWRNVILIGQMTHRPIDGLAKWHIGQLTDRPNNPSALTVRPKIIDTSAKVIDTSAIVGKIIYKCYFNFISWGNGKGWPSFAPRTALLTSWDAGVKRLSFADFLIWEKTVAIISSYLDYRQLLN